MNTLREESQGSNSGTAVTHDSDPRLLNFQLIDGDTLTGEGLVTQELGDTLDMSLLHAPGTQIPGTPGVVGPTIGDLTGGAVLNDINSVIVNAIPTICTKRLSAGAVKLNLNWTEEGPPIVIDGTGNAITNGMMHTVFNFERISDPGVHATYDPGECDYVTIGNMADAQGGHGTSDYTVQMPYSFAGRIPDWRLTGIDCTIGTGDEFRSFHVTELLDNNASYFNFYFKHGADDPVLIGMATLSDDLNITISPNTPLPEIEAGDHYLLHFHLVGRRIPNSVSVPYTLTAANCKTAAVAQGTEYSNEFTTGIGLPGADLIWPEISEAQGKAIESITYEVTVPYAAGALAPFRLDSPQPMSVTVGVNTAVTIPDVTLSDGPHTIALDHPTDLFTVDFISVMGGTPIEPGWYSLDNNGDLIPIASIPFDSGTIKANASDPTLQAETVNIPSSDLALYYGFVIGGFTTWLTQPYGPPELNNLMSTITLAYSQGLVATGIGVVTHLKTTPPDFEDLEPPSGIVVRETDTLMANPNLYPLSVPPGPSPGNYPFVMTEPYETRSRNLVAFKFHVYGEVGELTPDYMVKVFVSQGAPRDNNDDRLWTLIDMVDMHGPQGQEHTLHPNDTVTNLPEGYSDVTTMLRPATPGNLGPWNYYRLLIWSESPDQIGDLTLQITANAREVL